MAMSNRKQTRLVRARNRVNTAWSDIDVQLQRRHDLVPQLVAAVKHYAQYERATLEAVSELREAAQNPTNILERSEVDEQHGAGLGRLVALAENYPDLKASENFLELRNSIQHELPVKRLS